MIRAGDKKMRRIETRQDQTDAAERTHDINDANHSYVSQPDPGPVSAEQSRPGAAVKDGEDGLLLEDTKARGQKLAALHAKIRACRCCKERFGFEPHPIVSGSVHAKIIHISQAPGIRVHHTGKPFNDASGRKLREKWYQISDEKFYNPDNFYFAMAGHCYPGQAKNGDAKPSACCFDLWTRHELELLAEAKLILIVGKEASSRFFGERKLDELVFKKHEIMGRPAFVLPHPSGRNGPWLAKHPAFENEMLPQIRKAIHELIDEGEIQENRQISSPE